MGPLWLFHAAAGGNHMTTTSTRPGGPTPLAKGLIAFGLLTSAYVSVRHFAPGLFGGSSSSTPSSVPPRAALPREPNAPPTGGKAGCANLPETRMLIWAWNAQQGLLFANGGAQATEGSLMCRNGVNLKLTRQDAADQMQAELVKCAGELAKGNADCTAGAHYV